MPTTRDVDSREPSANAQQPIPAIKAAVGRSEPERTFSRRSFSVRFAQARSLDSGGEAIVYIRRADDLKAALAGSGLKLSDGIFEIVGDLLAEIVREEERDDRASNILERSAS
jgi:hypothetical protein